jgi:hypothetical protein
MALVCFPSATVAIKGVVFNVGPTGVADQCPSTCFILDDPIQRGALYVAVFARFEARSGGFSH